MSKVVKKYTATVEEYGSFSKFHDSICRIVKVLRKEDGEKVRLFYRKYGIKLTLKLVEKMQEIEYIIIPISARYEVDDWSELYKIIADEPFYVVLHVKWSNPSESGEKLEFIESKLEEIPEDEWSILQEALN